MGIIGKGSSSLKKKDVMEQKGIALGFKKIRFAHKATAGDTGIDLTSLVQPTEMATNGFVNPSVADLGRAQISLFRNNLKLVSSLRGLLIDQLSYVVASSTQINFLDFTAEDGEIFTGWLDETPTTSLSVVDGQNIVATGSLAVSVTDFNIGMPIEINKNPSQQVGAVLVYRNGLLQARCDGNNIANAGNYIEVPVGGGLGSLIRFKVAPIGTPDAIMVMSNGVIAERPDGSMTAMIERVQGQVDAMVPTLASVAGVPESTFQTAPNNVDLKQFGDQVIDNTALLQSMLNVPIPITENIQSYTPIWSATSVNPSIGNGTIVGKYSRDREYLEVQILLTANTTTNFGTGIWSFSIPSGLSIDFTKTQGSGQSATLGIAEMVSAGSFYVGTVAINSTTTVIITPNSNGAGVGSTVPAVWQSNTNNSISLNFKVPIAGWNSTQTIAEILGV